MRATCRWPRRTSRVSFRAPSAGHRELFFFFFFGSPLCTSLAFRLACASFIELVRAATVGAASAEERDASLLRALGEAQALHDRFAEALSPADKVRHSETLSLLAYVDPAASPVGHLLLQSNRVATATFVNGELLCTTLPAAFVA